MPPEGESDDIDSWHYNSANYISTSTTAIAPSTEAVLSHVQRNILTTKWNLLHPSSCENNNQTTKQGGLYKSTCSHYILQEIRVTSYVDTNTSSEVLKSQKMKHQKEASLHLYQERPCLVSLSLKTLAALPHHLHLSRKRGACFSEMRTWEKRKMISMTTCTT